MRDSVLSASAKIHINAPIERVWQLQADINDWPRWQKDVTFAKLDTSLKAGQVFRWKAMGLRIISKLKVVKKPSELAWSGNSLGMYAEHKWRFTKTVKGTLVETEESLRGWFPVILKTIDKKFLDKSLMKALTKLKSEAEI